LRLCFAGPNRENQKTESNKKKTPWVGGHSGVFYQFSNRGGGGTWGGQNGKRGGGQGGTPKNRAWGGGRKGGRDPGGGARPKVVPTIFWGRLANSGGRARRISRKKNPGPPGQKYVRGGFSWFGGGKTGGRADKLGGWPKKSLKTNFKRVFGDGYPGGSEEVCKVKNKKGEPTKPRDTTKSNNQSRDFFFAPGGSSLFGGGGDPGGPGMDAWCQYPPPLPASSAGSGTRSRPFCGCGFFLLSILQQARHPPPPHTPGGMFPPPPPHHHSSLAQRENDMILAGSLRKQARDQSHPPHTRTALFPFRVMRQGRTRAIVLFSIRSPPNPPPNTPTHPPTSPPPPPTKTRVPGVISAVTER